MRKFLFMLLSMVLSMSVMAQQKIQLRSADKAECVKSDMTSLQASFSFSTIEAQDVESQRGTFSWLSMANTVIGGNEGDPQIPVVNQLIAVPFGANPRIEITSYSTTDYRLDELGIHTLVPRQPSLRKDQRPEDVPFIMNEAAYRTRGFRGEPMAVVNVVGTMRGVQLGKMTIEPVSYDPVNNTIRVFNDIEVTVHFDGADVRATEDMLVNTYSPYFNGIYDMLFNGRSIRSAYDDHPDLYTTPVKMLVVTTSTYVNSTAFQNWLTWKKQKGIDVDVQTVANGATAATIKNLIYSRYNANHPSFLVIVGDETVVTYYSLWDYNSNYGNAATDLEYASVDGDVYHDMFISRMPVSSTTELDNLVNKILTYEKYTMADPSYLSNVLLIAGADGTWAPKVGRPTINYAADNYFNTAHGFTNVYKYVTSTYTGCYNYLSSGVGFANYTAHGDIQEWYDPNFTNSNISSLTNNDKYFWAMGNCCLTANFKNAQNNQTCFGEQMVRVANKGAFGYIGSVPESYWWEDYYFGVGATSTYSQTPSMSQTSTGVYDFMFDDTKMNTLNSVPYAGNVAVTYAHAGSYSYSVTDEYYWRAYQCFGDGSVMPYHTQPAANNVSHTGTLPIGANSYTVSADAGSYVSITVNNEIIGVAAVPSNSTSVSVPVTAQSVPGTAMIVVTRQQRQPYIGSINIVGGTQYNITVNQPQHGTISAPTQAYASATVTLSATPETGYCLSSWDVRDASNNSITVTNNQFTMPESNVTVTATFVQGMAVTLASVMNGSISADTEYALQGTTINLTATPANNYVFDSWVVYKTGDVNTTVTVNNNSFTMPNYPVTVSAIFNEVVTNEVSIGTGTSTNQYIPSYDYYDYSLTQQIYTQAEVGAAGKITKIAFYVSSNPLTRTIDIYMSHTSKSNFSSTSDWVSQGTSYRVVQGYQTFGQTGWNVITLDTPFEYNGTDNLLVTVDDNTGSWSSSKTSFYVYSTGANRAHYTYQDDTDFNPASISPNSSYNTLLQSNNRVQLTKQVPSTNGYLSVSPASLSGFNAVAGGAPSDPQSIAIVGNNLQANLTVTAPTGYQVCATQNGTYNSSLTLTPNNGSIRANVFVRLGTNPTPGEYNGNLTLASGTTTANVSLSGSVIPGNVQYAVTVAANPASGGNVTGAGEYNYNTLVTVTATANTGYTFINWTIDGTEVSTEDTYSFNVAGATALVANFTINSYEVTATPNPIIGGSVTVEGNRSRDNLVFNFENGSQGWTILQGPNSDSPNNWMHNTIYSGADYSTGFGHNASNGFMLSESFVFANTNDDGTPVHPDNYLVSPRILLGGSINFWVTNADQQYGAEHFAVAVSTNGNTNVNDFTTVQEWTLQANKSGNTRTMENGTWYEYTVDLSAYAGYGYVAIHHFNCYEQWLLGVDDITIIEGEPFMGVGTFNHGETCIVTATPKEGYTFVNWTENGNQVCAEATYSFEVTADRDLVANFELDGSMSSQEITLSAGCNWWSTNLEITLADLEAALGTNGVSITSQDGSSVSNNATYGWGGDLATIEVGKMYMIEMAEACTITVSGTVADPALYPITLNRGSNWIGFVGTEGLSLDEALSNLTPNNLDNIKLRNSTATYFQGMGWKGSLTTLEPGKGYIYNSKATTQKTFTFPSAK
jgi:hypothetical protein